MARLVRCRSVGGLSLKRNDELKALVIGEELIAFTPLEYQIVLQLLNGESLSDQTLIEAIYSTSTEGIHKKQKLERHIDSAKRKLRPTGLSIRRVHQFGYSLVFSPPGQAAADDPPEL